VRVLILISFMLSGCALLPIPGARSMAEVVVEIPPEEVMTRLEAVYRQLGIPVTEVDEEEGRVWGSSITSIWSLLDVPRERANLRCTLPGPPTRVALIAGAGQRGPRLQPVSREMPNPWVNVTVATTLQTRGDRTRVTTRVAAASALSGASRSTGGDAYCVSTGRLEQRIHSALADTPEVD
jgi:hypothetical protein